MSSTRRPTVTFLIGGLTDGGVARKNNEDTYLVCDLESGRTDLTHNVPHCAGARGTLLIVSDGMGGAEAGEVASRMAVDLTCERLVSRPADVSTEEAIRLAVEHANRLIHEEAGRVKGRKGMGATIVGALIEGSTLHVFLVGDSRLYLMRGARMRQVTRDQSMVESMVEAGMLTREQAEVHPSRNMILQAMGAKPEVVVAQQRVELRRGDIVLLCSDGLSMKLTAEEMRDCVLRTPNVSEAARSMVELAKARGGEDNITVVLAELDGEALPEAPRGERLTRTLQPLAQLDYLAGEGYAAPPPPKPTVPLASEPSPEPQPAVSSSSTAASQSGSTEYLASEPRRE
jgi:serine/threonine protein phosphatase PrpC